MWDLYLEATGITPDHRSIYVGDGAGRPGDYTDSDRKFALNIGVRYQTPEAFFRDQLEDPNFSIGPNFHEVVMRGNDTTNAPVTFPSDPEVIVMVGSPGSGKSTWCDLHVPASYEVVSQDTLKTKARCVSALKQALAQGRSVVMDDTNRSASVRKVYIDAAHASWCPVRCVHIDTEAAIAEHLNARTGKGACAARRDVYASAFEPPQLEEGFTSVTRVPFVYDDAACPQALFTQYHVGS